MDIPVLFGLLARLAVAAGCGGLVVAGYRWCRRRSAVIGTIIAVAVLARCAIVRCFAPVADGRCDLPCIAGVGAYSFAPASLLHSTQPLKDELSAALVVMACVGVLGLSGFIRTRTASRSSWLAALAGGIAV